MKIIGKGDRREKQHKGMRKRRKIVVRKEDDVFDKKEAPLRQKLLKLPTLYYISR